MATKTMRSRETEGAVLADMMSTRLLTPKEERALLVELTECRRKLSEALANVPGYEAPHGGDSPQAISQSINEFYAALPRETADQARLGAVYRRYNELRGRLAMANMRLVAHVAKRFRERGIAYGDLLQEGFCGLLEAIDRFDLAHDTKLATYATWWIRQAIQRAVAAGAYPVRLSPRHLRQLAQNQAELDATPAQAGASGGEEGEGRGVSTEVIQRIHAATRPTVSLDAGLSNGSDFNLLDVMGDRDADHTADVDLDETIGKLMSALRPREQEVIALRFGLGGEPRLSLSQVGKVMEVSKERVRQIQDRALEKLRAVAREAGMIDALPLGA
jgi:RNA polymerase primary sigma factor